MVITIDGPAGSGKTTIGRMLAEELGFPLIDSGLLYRAVTVEAQRRRIEPGDVDALVEMLDEITIAIDTDPRLERNRALVTVDGQDVTTAAHDPGIAGELSRISQIPEVRSRLVPLQRGAARGDAVVLGRDIGTVIFPDADVKFFFTASPQERMARRRRQLDRVRGSSPSDAMLEQEIEARDRADEQREIAPLRPASDAIIVATEGKSVRQVFDEVRARLPKH
ncbi:MAG TPA: (d)CMP kinase [Candidatus Dormibacteraeota bacterium]